MLLDEIKKVYGDKLPGKSAYRNDPEAPCTVEEISEEYGSWSKFVIEYNKKEEEAAPKKEAPQKTPAPSTKKVSKPDDKAK
tara:strand:- start:85 stop:327 length:243 start_codon:yes stop_codon:yes gene_type:complete